MRLIDADALRKEIHMSYSDDLGICEVIDNQPTAFNVNAVVRQIGENGQKMAEAKANMPYGKSTPGCHNYYKAISVKKATDIIRKGGVNERD